ncbi:MAG TPA: hypothetical protein GXX25_09415 [Desulfotomaculum sp.]|nr:hypothetical protein [Desulfotomaculum sp.]
MFKRQEILHRYGVLLDILYRAREEGRAEVTVFPGGWVRTDDLVDYLMIRCKAGRRTVQRDCNTCPFTWTGRPVTWL